MKLEKLDFLQDNAFFHEVYGQWSGHGFGVMLILESPEEELHKWVRFIEEDTNRVEVLDPDLYDLYLDVETEDEY